MKKISLRIMCLCLAAALCFGLIACGNQAADPTTEGTTLSTTQTTTSTQTTTEATTEATTQATTAATVDDGEPNYNVLTSTNPIKNIIIIIGDVMGLKHLDVGMLYDDKEYEFTKWPMVRVNTYPLVDASGEISSEPTDSAASGTAMATGKLTVNGRIGQDAEGNNLDTIMDLANSMGKATGVVTTDALHGATPSAFSAHASYRDNKNEIIPTQLTSGVNLLCSFAQNDYTLISYEIKQKGYAFCENFANVDSTFSSEYALWQLDMYGTDATNPLEMVTPKALEYLSQDPDGFVLMLEQAHVDKYSHANDFDSVCKAVSSLNKTVEAVMEWVGDRTDTLVLITADHETGGLQINNNPEKYANSKAFASKEISYEFRSTNHTGSNVALYVYGVTADFTRSDLYKKKILKNIGIYYLMEEALTAGQGTK